ncbi:hypothetical protein N0V93_004465 [Gnomoniopsis smithogilvyi]|uniref:Uncharacterized protein n=1 Tax=Gnomoniopsis smithogilvyi TaxID=1191159 RepID=A0A9W8YR47_9PEZI|nr:hypothetical protein N0V93_004465 [Gnomoniopsis smithogilvyi]
MAADDYPPGGAIYAPEDTPIDPVLQLHRSYVEPHSHELPSLATVPSQDDFGHQQHQQQQQYEQPPPQDEAGPVPSRASSDRDGFRPHQDPRPIIPPDLDTSRVDLTYRRNPRSHSANNPSPDGWLYPHKKGIGTGSNLEAFKDEIEARTMRGENCKTIAEALKALGVQTSDKAISRVRIKWGMRKRTQRKLKTPPPDSDAARLSAKTKIQTLRKIEITRMTQEGMTAEQIYENLTSRGMELKKGVATVLRLQSAWKLTQNPKRWLENFRHQCHKKAKAQQVQAFKDIAKELVLEDPDAWLEAKLAEQSVREARHELALKMMGDHAPTVNRRKLQARRGEARRGDESDIDSDEEGEPLGDEDWDNGLSNGEENDDVDKDASIYPTLDASPNGLSVSNVGQTDIDMGDDGDGTNSAANVTARDFDRIDQTLPEPANPASTIQKKHSQPPAQSSSTPMFSPTGATGPKRSKGQSTKSKKPVAKAVPSPILQAPTAQMIPDQPHALPDVEEPTSPRHQDTQAAAIDAMAVIAGPAASAPTLVLRPEEADANRAALSTLDQYHAAAQAYKEILQARTDNKPLAGSLTGLPPSVKDLELAKRRLKEVNQALMLNLE